MRGTLLYLNLAHFLDHYFLLIFPTAVLAIYPAWGMGYGEALALGTPAFIAVALGTPLAGWAGDRLGERPLIVLFFFGIGLASILTGLATGPMTLAVGMAAIGLFAAIYHPVGIAYLVRVAERTGAELGVNGVFGNLGVAAAAGLTGLLTAYVSWRAAFIVPGAVSILLGIAFARHARAVALQPSTPRPTTTLDVPLRQRYRVVGVVAVASLFGGLAFNGVTIALPKLFEERLDGAADVGRIGLYVALVFGLAAFTQIVTGRLIDRYGAKPVMMFMCSAQAALFVVLAQTVGYWSVILAVPLMLAVFGEVPVSAWLVSRYVPADIRGRVYSIQFLLGLGTASFTVPLIAVLHGATGSQSALFVVLGGAMALVFAAAFALPGRPRGKPAAAIEPAQ